VSENVQILLGFYLLSKAPLNPDIGKSAVFDEYLIGFAARSQKGISPTLENGFELFCTGLVHFPVLFRKRIDFRRNSAFSL